jgi:hypothetical protein
MLKKKQEQVINYPNGGRPYVAPSASTRRQPRKVVQGFAPKLLFVGTMPLSPSVNGSYEIVTVYSAKKQRMVNTLGATKELKQFKRDAAKTLKRDEYIDRALIRAVIAQNTKPNKVGLYIVLRFYFKTPWLRDADGAVKASTDALFEYLGINDRTAVRLDVAKDVDSADPHCEVEVYIAPHVGLDEKAVKGDVMARCVGEIDRRIEELLQLRESLCAMSGERKA